jgi:hypothetical protein
MLDIHQAARTASMWLIVPGWQAASISQLADVCGTGANEH